MYLSVFRLTPRFSWHDCKELNLIHLFVPSVQFSRSVVSNSLDCNTSGFPVHYQLPEPTQTHVPHVSDAIQPPHTLLSPSPSAFNLPQIRVFSNELAHTAKVLAFQL